MLPSAEFVQSLTLQMPTLYAGLGLYTVACQTIVNTQCKSLLASALLSGACPLAPMTELNLVLHIQSSDGCYTGIAHIHYTSGQLRSRQRW